MNSYFCHIDLKQDAKALLFAKAVEAWMDHLKSEEVILDWRLSRRKLNLASGMTRDFMLEITVENLTQLDAAFRLSGSQSETVRARHRAVHDLIAEVDFGLYRPFPDPQRSDFVGLV
jgi:DNA-binding Lrp family transcriptional regulator